MGVATLADRLRRRRFVGGGDGAAQRVAGSVPDLSGPGLAHRRRRTGPLGRHHRRGDDGLVVRLRLFPRRPLLGRLRLPGRCADLRLAAPDRGHRPAVDACVLYCARCGGGADAVDAGCAPHPLSRCGADRDRMAARPCADRFSLECLGLCPHLPAGAGAGRRGDRALGPHLHRDRRFRESRDADRRACGNALGVAAARARNRGARRPRRLRRMASLAHADAAHRRGASAHHAAEPAAGRPLQLRRQAGGHEPLRRAVRPRLGPAIARRARRDPPDLAGIGVSVLPHARTRRARADRATAAGRYRC